MRSLAKSILNAKWMPGGAMGLGLLEGTIVVFPTEPVVIPMMAADKRKAWRIALYLSIGNVAGAIVVYWLALWLADHAIVPMLRFFELEEEYRDVSQDMRERGLVAFWALIVIGITPVPYQLGTAAAGAIGYSFPMYVLAIAISRFMRYFALVALLAAIGDCFTAFLDRHSAALLLAGLLAFFLVAGALFAFGR